MSKNKRMDKFLEPLKEAGLAELPPSNGEQDSPLVSAAQKRIAAIDATIANVQGEMNNLNAQYQQRGAIIQELQRERAEWVEGLK